MRMYFHYGWLIVAMGTILQVTTSFIGQAFSILLFILHDPDWNFGWSLTAITLGYTFRSIVAAVLSPVAGWLGDRYGARPVLLVGGVLFVGGMLLLSSLTRLWQLYIYYSVILGISQALFSVNIPTTVAAWFRQRLGVAVGLQQSAGGMGSSIMTPTLALLLVQTGWQTTFWIIATFGGVMIFSLLWLFHSDPVDRGMKPYGATVDDPPPMSNSDPEVTKVRSRVFLQHVRKTNAFWNLIAIHPPGVRGPCHHHGWGGVLRHHPGCDAGGGSMDC